jgi:hypothetical protein
VRIVPITNPQHSQAPWHVIHEHTAKQLVRLHATAHDCLHSNRCEVSCWNLASWACRVYVGSFNGGKPIRTDANANCEDLFKKEQEDLLHVRPIITCSHITGALYRFPDSRNTMRTSCRECNRVCRS